MKLALDLRAGEAVCVGAAVVRLEKKSGQAARLVVSAPQHVPIHVLRAPQRDVNHTMCKVPVAACIQAMR